MSKSKTNYIPRDIPTSRTRVQLTDENKILIDQFKEATQSSLGKHLSTSYLINLIISASLRPTKDNPQ